MTDDPKARHLKTEALSRLDKLIDPKSGLGLVEAGLVKSLTVSEAQISFVMEIQSEELALYLPIRHQAEQCLSTLPDILKAHVVMTAEKPGTSGSSEGRKSPVEDIKSAQPISASNETGARTSKTLPIRYKLAIASAKGGVGKSSLALNLACAFAKLGRSTGLLDADIHGPSLPTLLGLSGQKPKVTEDKQWIPMQAYGLQAMSVGLLIPDDAAMIWRGPMASRAAEQLIQDTAWGTVDQPLDCLVIDTPPGTGDIFISLTQKGLIDGVIVITTPQTIAMSDVRRGLNMLEKTKTPVIGLIENMSYFLEPATGKKIPLFGEGGGRIIAQTSHIAFLGEVPIDMDLRLSCDRGEPLVATSPNHPISQIFLNIARSLIESVKI